MRLKDVMLAQLAIEEAFGHHTAHLDPAEQIEVGVRVIASIARNMADIAEDERAAPPQGEKP